MSVTITKHANHKLILVTEESIPAFIQLINRAMNTWDQAPPELKVFADEFIHGKALQDYAAQDSSVKKDKS